MAKGQWDLSEYEEENRPLAQKVMDKRFDNHKRVERLEQQGTTMDIGTARIEFFMRQLVKAGVLGEDQLLGMQLDWEENMAAQLAMIEDRVALRQDAMRRRMEEQQRQAQIAKPQSGLFLPNGRVHLPQPEQEKKNE